MPEPRDHLIRETIVREYESGYPSDDLGDADPLPPAAPYVPPAPLPYDGGDDDGEVE